MHCAHYLYYAHYKSVINVYIVLNVYVCYAYSSYLYKRKASDIISAINNDVGNNTVFIESNLSEAFDYIHPYGEFAPGVHIKELIHCIVSMKNYLNNLPPDDSNKYIQFIKENKLSMFKEENSYNEIYNLTYLTLLGAIIHKNLPNITKDDLNTIYSHISDDYELFNNLTIQDCENIAHNIVKFHNTMPISLIINSTSLTKDNAL